MVKMSFQLMAMIVHSDILKLLWKLSVTSMASLCSQKGRFCAPFCSVDLLLNLSFHAISHDSDIDAGLLHFSSVYYWPNNIPHDSVA